MTLNKNQKISFEKIRENIIQMKKRANRMNVLKFLEKEEGKKQIESFENTKKEIEKFLKSLNSGTLWQNFLSRRFYLFGLSSEQLKIYEIAREHTLAFLLTEFLSLQKSFTIHLKMEKKEANILYQKIQKTLGMIPNFSTSFKWNPKLGFHGNASLLQFKITKEKR